MFQRVMSRLSVENFLSHSTETFRRGTLLCCFRKILVAKTFMEKKGGVPQFSVENFCLTVPKNFVGEPSRLPLFRVSKKFMLKRVISRFFVESFLSHSTETFRRGTLLCWVSENIWWRKSLWRRRGGEYHIFPSKFFFSQCRKTS